MPELSRPLRYKEGIGEKIPPDEWERLDPTEKADLIAVHKVMQRWEKKKEKKPVPPKKKR